MLSVPAMLKPVLSSEGDVEEEDGEEEEWPCDDMLLTCLCADEEDNECEVDEDEEVEEDAACVPYTDTSL